MMKLPEESVATKTSKTFSEAGSVGNNTLAPVIMLALISCSRTIVLITPSLRAR